VPDLAVGLTWIGCGVWVRSRNRSAGALAMAVGAAWFLGGVVPGGLYWHRGPLVHLLLAYPRWRPRTRLGMASVGAGYVVAVATPVWRDERASITLACALAAAVLWEYAGAVGHTRHRRTHALQATAALSLVLIAGAVARLAVPEGNAAIPALLAYEAVLCGAALGLASGLWRSGSPAITDLVVDLGETRSGPLRDALPRVLGDPSLQIGYWVDSTGGYVDDAGRPVSTPGPGEDRSATTIELEGRPFAVLVHDAAVLEDPSLVAVVGTATRLTASNAALQAEVRAQVDELTASRRRLVVAAAEERARLEERLERGAEQHLVKILATLRTASPDRADEHLVKAMSHLERTVGELHDLARGLYPRELAEGLRPALAALTQASAVPVQLHATGERFPAEVEVAAYFTCAEALANVTKHAGASSDRST